jgi:hypothetical protein
MPRSTLRAEIGSESESGIGIRIGSESLDQHFGPGKPWHFYSIDKQNKLLVSRVSKVIDRLKNRVSKFFFMKTKK